MQVLREVARDSHHPGHLIGHQGAGHVGAGVSSSEWRSLFARTLTRLREIDFGFDRERVTLVRLDPRRCGYAGPRLQQFYRDLVERVTRLPVVRSAALADATPVGGGVSSSEVTIERYVPGAREETRRFILRVTPEYFVTIGQQLRAGTHVPEKRDGSSMTAVVNEAFAHRFAYDGAIGFQATISRTA